MASMITSVNLHAVPFNQGQLVAIRDIVHEHAPDHVGPIMDAILKVAEQGERKELEYRVENKMQRLRECLQDIPVNHIPRLTREEVIARRKFDITV